MFGIFDLCRKYDISQLCRAAAALFTLKSILTDVRQEGKIMEFTREEEDSWEHVKLGLVSVWTPNL